MMTIHRQISHAPGLQYTNYGPHYAPLLVQVPGVPTLHSLPALTAMAALAPPTPTVAVGPTSEFAQATARQGVREDEDNDLDAVMKHDDYESDGYYDSVSGKRIEKSMRMTKRPIKGKD